MVWLGEISYEIFLLHVVVMALVLGVVLHWPLFTGSMAVLYAVTLAITIPIGVGASPMTRPARAAKQGSRNAGTNRHQGPPPMRGRVLLLRRELGRPMRDDSFGDEHRVVAEPAVAPRFSRDRCPASSPRTTVSPDGEHQRARRHERRAAPLSRARRSFAPAAAPVFAGVVAVPPRPPCRQHTRACRSARRPPARSRRPPTPARSRGTRPRALASAFSSNVAPVSGASSNGRDVVERQQRQPDDARGVEHAPQFGQLLAVAAGHRRLRSTVIPKQLLNPRRHPARLSTTRFGTMTSTS